MLRTVHQPIAQRASAQTHTRPARRQLTVKAIGDPAASSRPGGRGGRDAIISTPASTFDGASSLNNVQRPGGRGGRGALPAGMYPTSTVAPQDVSRPGGGAFRGGPGGNGGEGGGSGQPGGNGDGMSSTGPVFFLLFAGIVGTAVVQTSRQAASKQA